MCQTRAQLCFFTGSLFHNARGLKSEPKATQDSLWGRGTRPARYGMNTYQPFVEQTARLTQVVSVRLWWFDECQNLALSTI